MREYTLKSKAPLSLGPCSQGIPIDTLDIAFLFEAWKEDPATNRQRKVLQFFNYSFPHSITKGIATSYVSRIFRNSQNHALWNRYVKLTNDTGDETPDLRPFDISELLRAELLNNSDAPSNIESLQSPKHLPVAIFGCGIPQKVIAGPPPPTDAQIEFLTFIGEINIPSTRRRANALITRIVLSVRSALSDCFYNRNLIDEHSERTVVQTIRKSRVSNAVLAWNDTTLSNVSDELRVSVIRIVMEAVNIAIRDGLKVKGIRKLRPLLESQRPT